MSKRPLFVLGPEGTNSHLAALCFLKKDNWPIQFLKRFQLNLPVEDIVFCRSNSDALLSAREAEGFCVVPVENSRGGLVDDSVRFWLEQSHDCPVRVVGGIYLPVKHRLLMHADGCEGDVTKIVSHPQALSQCSRSIRIYYPNAITSPSASTAAAARDIAEEFSPTVAVIGDEGLSVRYGLKIARMNMNDFKGNVTRFHLVGPEFPPMPSCSDKTAVIFRRPDKPGSLSEMLSIVDNELVNMSSIHSITLGVMEEYAFYLEADFHQLTGIGKNFLDQMRGIDKDLLVLGSFSPVKFSAKHFSRFRDRHLYH